MPFGNSRPGQKLEVNQRIDLIEKAIESEQMISFNFQENISESFKLDVKQKKSKKQATILPLKLVYLDGELELIGEELQRGILRPYLVEDINNIEGKSLPKDYRKNITSQDVVDYIESGRLIIENEERLVLKISSGSNIDLAPAHLYMGSPFAAVNSDGDMIWAATVEVSNPLLKWLSELKDVEVLDPPTIAIQVQLYSQNNRK